MILLLYLDLRSCSRLQITWVKGMRQIVSGIDSFSRGCLTDGIASYGYILDFVPLNETAFES